MGKAATPVGVLVWDDPLTETSAITNETKGGDPAPLHRYLKMAPEILPYLPEPTTRPE